MYRTDEGLCQALVEWAEHGDPVTISFNPGSTLQPITGPLNQVNSCGIVVLNVVGKKVFYPYSVINRVAEV